MSVNLVSLTTVNRKRLYGPAPMPATETTLYTVPASTDVKIQSIVLSNTTTSPAVINMSVVATGGTAGTANRVIPGFTVDANDVIVLDAAIDMTAGDFISGVQVTSGAINITISGETYA